jgi:hypothetical protein
MRQTLKGILFSNLDYYALHFVCINIRIMVRLYIKEYMQMGNGKHGLLKTMVVLAAAGGVCYAMKDKIKASKAYQSLDVDDKVEKVKNTIKEKMPSKEENDRDYFTLNDDTTEDASQDETAAAKVPETAENISDKVNDLLSDIPEIKITREDVDKPADDKQGEPPVIYENDGLSDVSEDIDVLEEQDKLDI